MGMVDVGDVGERAQEQRQSSGEAQGYFYLDQTKNAWDNSCEARIARSTRCPYIPFPTPYSLLGHRHIAIHTSHHPPLIASRSTTTTTRMQPRSAYCRLDLASLK
jgi:hypothetical protein